MLRSFIRILRASLVQIDTKMTKKYSNQRYVVEMLQAPIHTQCPIQPAIRPESRFLPTHLHSTPPLGGFSSEYCHPVWYGKTRMVWLPDSEKISKISLFVLTWFTNVTDGRTNGRTDTQTPHADIGRAYASHRAAKTGHRVRNTNYGAAVIDCKAR